MAAALMIDALRDRSPEQEQTCRSRALDNRVSECSKALFISALRWAPGGSNPAGVTAGGNMGSLSGVGYGESLAVILARLRLDRGLSQVQLAGLAGLSPQEISDIEAGTTRNPRRDTVRKIVTGLGLPADGPEHRELLSLRQAGTGHDDVTGTVLPGQPPADEPAGTFLDGTFAGAVRYLRAKAGLSVAALAERAGVSQRTIRDIEAGRRLRVHPRNAAELAGALTRDGSERARFLLLAAGTAVPDGVRLAVSAPGRVAGRDLEIATVAGLVASRRLVSLEGTGGIGKTTLAEAVLALERDRSCVSFSLADVPAGETLARAIALMAKVDVTEGTGWVANLAPLVAPDSIVLLDNLEHLEQVPEGITEIRAGRPDVTILATSRSPVQHDEAVHVEVGPLALAAAAEVFWAIASQARPQARNAAQIAAIEQICVRLDRLPLAVTLAAQLTRVMAPGDILDRLNKPARILRLLDVPETDSGPAAARHRAITLTVGWSLDLVSYDAGLIFRALAAYPAPWPLGLVEAILPGTDFLPALNELIQARLVAVEGDAVHATYRMLQTVAAVAGELLAADPGFAAQVRQRHAERLLDLAGQLSKKFAGTGAAAAMSSGDQLALHVEAALHHLVETADRRAIAMAACFWRYWEKRGRYRAGSALLSEVISRFAADDMPTAEATYGAATLAYWAADNERAAALAADALRRFRALRNPPGTGNLMSLIGMMELHSQRPESALRWYEQGLAQTSRTEDPEVYARLLANIAPVHAALNDLTAAQQAAEEAAELFRELRDYGAVGAQVGNIGDWAARTGDHERALRLLTESRELLQSAGVISNLIDTHLSLARLHTDAGDIAAARTSLDAARQLGATADDPWGDALADALSAQVAMLAGDMAEAGRLARQGRRKGTAIGYEAAICAAELAAAAVGAWTGDAPDALAHARDGLSQSSQADEAMVISLALIVVAVRRDGAAPAVIDPRILDLENGIRRWAAAPSGRPYAIAAIAARQRGLAIAPGTAQQPSSLPPIAAIRQLAITLCPPQDIETGSGTAG